MSYNEIDEIIDSKINNLYSEIRKEKIYEQILKEANFVRFQSKILNFMEDFNKKNKSKFSKNLEKNSVLLDENITTLLYYYFFIGLSYHYKGGRDSFITNIIEISKNQSKSKIKVPGFFNSNSNSIIIRTYDIVKNSIELVNQKTIERIKSSITNAPIKYETTLDFIKNITLDFFKNNIVDNKDNFHILIKTIVIKNIYQESERENIISILNQDKNDQGEFRYITIVTAKVGKMVDYNIIEKMLTPEQIRQGFAEDIYNYILDYKEKSKLYVKNRENIVDYLFSEKILVPITEEFLRFHKKTEKYQKTDKTNKDETKAKYIISKLKQIQNYYSDVVKKDPKKKLNVKNLFYTPMMERMATLVNQAEDAKIISKLKQTDNNELLEVLNDIENLSRYSYLNFNNLSKDGIKIRPSKEIQAVRKVNLDPKNNVKNLETRMGNDLIDLNVIGVMFLPEKELPDLIKKKNLVEVDDKSPYQDFIKKVEKEFVGPKSSKTYFWLFDTKKDELKTDLYQDVSGTDTSKTIQVFLEDFYDKYYEMLLKKVKKLMSEKKVSSLEDFQKLIDSVSNQYAKINREPEIFNELVKYYRQKIIKELPVTPDEVDNQIPNQQKDLIKLPVVKVKSKINKVIDIEENITKKSKDNVNVKSICLHHITWKSLLAMRKKDIDVFNQKIFDFVKKYVRLNDSGEYICKSCNELVPIGKYVYSGTYIAEKDTFLTTSIAVNQNLERIPKYRKFNRTIKNLDRLVERIGLLSNFNIFLGNTPVIKLRRRLIIKDTIDLILDHTDTLSKLMKNRNEAEGRGRNMKQKYNIEPSYSKLFFFQLKDDIFLTSSEDTDKYKIIKYNNLIVYLMLMIMLEINSGQILGIKETKFYNYYFFQKFNPLLSKLKIRLSEKEVISVSKIPLLAYTIYIMSGMISKDGIWFGVENKKGVNVEAQKEIIHSFIDLVNSIIETSFTKNKSFIYESLAPKILNQIKGTFQDIRVFNMIEKEKKGNMIINSETKKLQYMEKRHKGIIVNENKSKDTDLIDFQLKDKDFDKCYTELKTLQKKEGINYADYITTELNSEKLKEQLKLYLQKICSRDKLEKWEKTLCDKYGPKFDKNLNDKDIQFFLKNIQNNQTQKFLKNKLQEDKIIKKNKQKLERRKIVLDSWEAKFKKENGFTKYLDKFIKNIKSIVGNKIKTDKLKIHIDDNMYEINHDYLGNPRKDILYIYESEGLFKKDQNNSFFKQPVRYFFDKKSRTYMFYHIITNQYLGYSINKDRYQKLTTNNYIHFKYSFKGMIERLGLVNKYERILDYFPEIPKSNSLIVKTILDNRIKNLKNIIRKANSIIYQIKHQHSNNNDTKEKELVTEFIERINNFKVKNNDGKSSVFKNINHITNLNSLPIEGDFLFEFEGYFSTNILKKLGNADNKLLFYFIYELNKLVEYNKNKKLQSELSYMIISIVKFLFNTFYKLNYSIDIQKFYVLSKLIDDDSMVDERVSFVGMYSELLKQEDLENEELLEKQYDAEQEGNAIDYDDNDSDDDFAFDNDIEIPEN